MDTLRAMAALAAERVARSRPAGVSEDERGQGLAEYSLILGLIAVVAIVSLVFLGSTISDLFWAPISKDFGDVLSRILGP